MTFCVAYALLIVRIKSGLLIAQYDIAAFRTERGEGVDVSAHARY